MEKDRLTTKGFEVDTEVKLQLQVKMTQYIDEGVEVTMIQFIDLSDSIRCDEQDAANKLLELINACISHELRNPLNSIIA